MISSIFLADFAIARSVSEPGMVETARDVADSIIPLAGAIKILADTKISQDIHRNYHPLFPKDTAAVSHLSRKMRKWKCKIVVT